MIRANDVIVAMDTFVDSRIEQIVSGNPLLSLAQPFIKRAVKRQLESQTGNIKNYLKLLADKEGKIGRAHV